MHKCFELEIEYYSARVNVFSTNDFNNSEIHSDFNAKSLLEVVMKLCWPSDD